MSGFIPKEKLTVYENWEMPDFEEETDPTSEQKHSTAARVENAIIPKEQLTAYERWELAAFNESHRSAEEISSEKEYAGEATGIQSVEDNAAGKTDAGSFLSADSPAKEVLEDGVPVEESEIASAVVFPTAAEIEKMHEDARQQGYQEGYQEGYTTGQSEGNAHAQEKVSHLDSLLTDLNQSLQTIDQEVAEKLLATAVELASQMVRESLKIKPELVLPVIREAMQALNLGSGHPLLHVHPDDALIVREYLAGQLTHNNWRLIEDASITPGGCRVELGAGEVDASVETRWKRILESLGINQQWLDEKE